MIKSIERQMIKSVTFPFTNWLYNRKNIIKNYKKLIRTEHLSKDELYSIQLNKLKKIIKYSLERIPFYQKRFRHFGININDIKSLEDFKEIPSLSRQDVIDNHLDMIDIRVKNSALKADNSKEVPGEPIFFAKFKKNKLIRNTSSGSTGYPTTFYEDGSVTAMNWSHELRLKKWYGIDPGEREARLVRMSTDYMPNSKIIKMRKLLWNQLLLPGVNLKEKDYKIIYEQIVKFQPKVLWGFTSALTGFAEFLRSENISVRNLQIKLIITWAAPLYPHERDILEKVFECSVTNIYGTRELGHIAQFCQHDKLHINQENYIVETKKNGNSKISSKGELLVTSLIDSPMPFIRYRTGDIGSVKYIKCECGKTLQTINEFIGRTGEIYTTKDGRMISPNFWCRTFMEPKRAGSIKRFQVIYKKNGTLNIKMVKNNNYSKIIEDDLKKYLIDNFDNSLPFNFEYVSDIKSMVSGKYQMVIKEQ